jgi:hypothetical protein
MIAEKNPITASSIGRPPQGAAASDPVPAATPGFGTRYFNAFRVATYLLVLYALGHTLGAVTATPQFGPESDTVAAMMKSVVVRAQGSECTWYGFYRGFGILVSVFFVFSAILTWQLGGMTARQQRALGPVTWALFASYAASAVVSVAYFFVVPIVFSTAITLALAAGCVRARRP